MGALVSGNKTAFLNALTTVENDIAQLGTDYATLVAALVTLGVTDDGTVYLGSAGTKGLRLFDILSPSQLARLAAMCMVANNLRAVLDAYDDLARSNLGTTDIVTAATTILTGH